MTRALPSEGRPARGFRPGWDHVRLVARLMRDPRVPWYLKLLPLTALIYFIAPDFFPTPLDDAVIVTIGVGLFLELAPSEVVAEHRRALQGYPVVDGRVRPTPTEDKKA